MELAASQGRRVLFLDVDGVLNSHTRSKTFLALSKPMLRRLAKIVQDTGCELVLSSTWRLDDGAVRRLNNHLRYRNCYVSAVTPHLPAANRGLEISTWLSEHPDVERYAIVDDDSDMLDSQLRNFFQTDGAYGLTDTIAYRIAHHLNPSANGG